MPYRPAGALRFVSVPLGWSSDSLPRRRVGRVPNARPVTPAFTTLPSRPYGASARRLPWTPAPLCDTGRARGPDPKSRRASPIPTAPSRTASYRAGDASPPTPRPRDYRARACRTRVVLRSTHRPAEEAVSLVVNRSVALDRPPQVAQAAPSWSFGAPADRWITARLCGRQLRRHGVASPSNRMRTEVPSSTPAS